ncbi:HEAT repeat domain-containing protein [Acinetobacter sp. CFCC 10889]|uniref:HEAT repeat domain-containing protein n=1 Tax=Acinetobacter sp. CFCC 10889 TaxID=1775557 RepID=UPI000DD0C0EF|nr:HEAT repeat domain-containing protein [Acinetobacter sp. CFCC 10889]
MHFHYPELDHLDDDDLGFLEQLNQADEKRRFVTLMNIADEEREDLLPWLHYAVAHDPSALVRVEAAKRLEGWEDSNSLQALAQALLDKDVSVVNAATQSLSEVKQEKSADVLVTYLSNEVSVVKVAILRALKPLRYVEAYAQITQHTQHSDALVRREAVSTLSWLQQEQAVDNLSQIAQHDSDLETRRIATGGLGYVKQPSDAVIHALAQGLQSENWQLRVEAALTIGKLKLQMLESDLIALLYDRYWQVRIAVTRSLGVLKSVQALDGLAHNFDFDLSNLRKEVALALGEIGGERAEKLLQAHADDADPEVRKAIRIGLGQIVEREHAH